VRFHEDGISGRLLMRKSSFAMIRVLVSLLLVAVPLLSAIPVPWVVTYINAYTYTIHEVSTSTNYQINLFTGSEIPLFTLREVTYSTEYVTVTSYERCTPGYGVSCPPYLLVTVQVPNETRFRTITEPGYPVTNVFHDGTVFYTILRTSPGTGYLPYTYGTSTGRQVFPVTTGTITSSSTHTLRQTAIVQAAEFLTSLNVLFVVLFLLPLSVMATVIALTFLEREQAFCPRCEARLRRGAGFCDKCGFRL
jgi:hypothetical protein